MVINNLVASMLWHTFTVLDPPKELLSGGQKAFVNFFWDGCHWLPPGILYLPVAEGGQGLIHLESKVLAMRLQNLYKNFYIVQILCPGLCLDYIYSRMWEDLVLINSCS